MREAKEIEITGGKKKKKDRSEETSLNVSIGKGEKKRDVEKRRKKQRKY